ncbi:alkene reductase [Sphingopyxis sp. 550A]
MKSPINSAFSALFEPLRIGRYDLPNRIIMAPMARLRCDENGVPAEYVKKHFEQRASAGLVIADSVYVDPRGRMSPYLGGLCTKVQCEAWAQVAAAVHAKGGLIFLSLIHSGRISTPSLQPGGGAPVAPSAIKACSQSSLDMVVPRALETGEVQALVADFAAAGRRAIEAGFDGVEFHSANGYLGSQFLASGSNRRTDQYGGSVENRCRFSTEVMNALADAIGGDRVGIKISPGFQMHDNHDADPQETHACLIEKIQALGLAYVHIGTPLTVFGKYHELDFDPTGFVRGLHKGILVRSGNLNRHLAAEGIAAGLYDAASFGRRFIANPDFVERVRLDAPENILDDTTLDTPGLRGYMDYPTLDGRSEN